MYFDDRLATVLRTRAGGAVTARIQYRQLLDLLGTMPPDMRGDQIDAAYDRLTRLGTDIAAADRAMMITDPGLRIRSPRLVAMMAESEPVIASAVIAKAQLDEEQWQDLVPALPVQARGFLRNRRDLGARADALLARLGIQDRGLPDARADLAASAARTRPIPANDELLPDQQSGGAPETIGSLVKRIEAFRKARREDGAIIAANGEAPRLPLGEEALLRAPQELRSFDFATDAAARIIWADPGVAPMVIGLALASRDPASAVIPRSEVIHAIQRRQPITAGIVSIIGSPAIAGGWQIDATPGFDPVGGQFAGYRGRMRRPAAASVTAQAAPRDSEADRIRQLLHELRTPVNAIQGFAEIIQQQLFGPTPHEYRALAAAIASDGARILAGFEDLERLARLDSGAELLEAGTCDLGRVIAATVAQLEHHTAARSSGFAAKLDDGPLAIAIAEADAERLIWRLLATLAGAASPGEMLKLRAKHLRDAIRITIQLPAALAARDDHALLHAGAGSAPQALSSGMFGSGFALRLAASEARAAGGTLERRGEKMRLVLPGLTALALDHSQEEASGAA